MAKITKEILTQARKEGLTVKQIAAKYGVTRQAVWAMKKKYDNATELENKDIQDA